MLHVHSTTWITWSINCNAATARFVARWLLCNSFGMQTVAVARYPELSPDMLELRQEIYVDSQHTLQQQMLPLQLVGRLKQYGVLLLACTALLPVQTNKIKKRSLEGPCCSSSRKQCKTRLSIAASFQPFFLRLCFSDHITTVAPALQQHSA